MGSCRGDGQLLGGKGAFQLPPVATRTQPLQKATGEKCANGHGPLFFPPNPHLQLWPASRH